MILARVVYAWLYALVSPKLGRCAFCMGVALGGTVIGWAVLAAVASFWPRFPFLHLLALWPIGFTALWLLHIATYGGRHVTKEIRESQPASATGPAMSRRRMVGIFASSVALGIIASVMAASRVLAGAHKGFGSCCSPAGGICFVAGFCKAGGECVKDGFAGHCVPKL